MSGITPIITGTTRMTTRQNGGNMEQRQTQSEWRHVKSEWQQSLMKTATFFGSKRRQPLVNTATIFVITLTAFVAGPFWHVTILAVAVSTFCCYELYPFHLVSKVTFRPSYCIIIIGTFSWALHFMFCNIITSIFIQWYYNIQYQIWY